MNAAAASATSTTVRFSGLAGAVAPMTWSQFGMWGAVKKFRPYDTYLNVSLRVEIPSACSLDDVLSVIRDMLVKHEALRTRYFDSDDGIGRQEVAESGEVEVLLEHDTEGSLDHSINRLADRSFDFDSEFPARFSVRHVEGRPAWLLVVVSHLSIDGLARNRLIEEFTARLAGDHRYGDGQALLTPVSKALEESSPSGVLRNERTITRWQRFLERVDVTNFAKRVHDEREPRWLRASMFSPALGSAFDRIADRNQVTSPAVYVALSATAVSALSGHATSALRCMISNRFTAGEKRYIGNLSQACAFDVRVADAVFDEVVQRSMVASIRGYSMGRYRIDELEKIVDPAKFDAMHNDFRDAAASSQPQQLLAVPEIRSLRSQTVIEPPQRLQYYDDKFHMEVRQGAGAPAPAVMIDRCYIPVAEPRVILLAMEAFALAMLSDSRHLPAVDVFKATLAEVVETDGGLS
ncbi:condensation domain-containing protein [Streptomyces sp. SBT349]|uniref:condensation domain-containing protein n=1 Tax=Streptomyces sp. SBT349 TaxID=1580539 RepID=UPI00099D830A|nr:condensation domain-containing protein [Streptomyces sp. SBT349]